MDRIMQPSHVGADVVPYDGDIYLRELSIPNIHPDVESALREAVACFQAELFTASMAMLGKASEGAWLDLGRSLVSVVPIHRREAIRNQVARLEDPMEGIGRKIGAVIDIFKRRDLLGDLSDAVQVRHQDLQQVAIWSDIVRDSRNTIHFGVAPAMANTFEKVATLLIGAIPYLRILYALKEKADKHATVMSKTPFDA